MREFTPKNKFYLTSSEIVEISPDTFTKIVFERSKRFQYYTTYEDPYMEFLISQISEQDPFLSVLILHGPVNTWHSVMERI